MAFADPVPGYFARTPDARWEPFQSFTALPDIDWAAPALRFVDLTGDGLADILITADDLFTVYPSRGAAGFGPAAQVSAPWDEARGPRLVLADGTQAIFLADMTGDGLSDLVRVRSGEVCYWPNCGYGRFGAQVTMDAAPRLAPPDQFDPQRVRLADIDGSGTTDLLYIGEDGVLVCFNQSGNGWAAPQRLAVFPTADAVSAVDLVDLLGTGTACLVWSSPLPAQAPAPLRYVDLLGGQKPHLLVGVRNNLGAETRVQYAPSARFYLADKLAGRPWVTRLPFPVHVVERVETYDWIGRSHFVTRYAYHHGYFDGYEREFRGFGLVEQWDTEEHRDDAAFGDAAAANWDAASWTPPLRTCTWFHTGAFVEAGRVSQQYAHEYWVPPALRDDPALPAAERDARRAQRDALLLPDTVLPPDLSPDEMREAYRALRGVALRTEVYAEDGSPQAAHPYLVTEQNLSVRRLQARGANRHAVFFAHAHESTSAHYERHPDDPRVAHTLTLEVDDYGTVLKAAAIGYGRRAPDPDLAPADQAAQTQTLVTFTETAVTNAVADGGAYRAPLPWETRTYELTGYAATGRAGRFQPADFVAPDPADPTGRRLIALFDGELPYEAEAPSGRQRRLIAQARTLYRKDDLTDLLAPGVLESRALPGDSYRLAFTPGLLDEAYAGLSGGPGPGLAFDPAAALGGRGADQGGFVDLDGNGQWWVPSGRIFYSVDADPAHPATTAGAERAEAAQHFFLPRQFTDPFGQSSTVDYAYDLLVATTRDGLGNTVRAQHDFRVLQPVLVTDPNGNRTAAAFDTLGLVAGTAVLGKPPPAPVEGDSLDGFAADLTADQVAGLYAAGDPRGPAPTLLGSATTRVVYDLDRFQRSQQAYPTDPAQWRPAAAATLARETHAADPLPADGLRIQIQFAYSDGFGREIQTKNTAEPGPVVEGGPVVDPRWVASGWTVFNNKGQPVRQYEPFFSGLPDQGHEFEFGVQAGVSPILCYDPAGRVVATLHPNHTWAKVVFDPWRQQTYDVNDTVLVDPATDPNIGGFASRLPPADYLPTWYAQRVGGDLGAPEQQAAQGAAVHAGTPAIAYLDTLGRPFLTVAHNRFIQSGQPVDEFYATRVELDIAGNQRAVTDARDRIVMRYRYDMLGTRIYQASMEAGARWLLPDVLGRPIRAWDTRGFSWRCTYDALRRPTGTFVTEHGSERQATRTVYGESQGDAANHRTRVYQIYDGAGVATSEAYDFNGNLLRGRRDLLPTYRQAVDWQQNPLANDGGYTTSTTYDALNRPAGMTTPDGSIYQPTYNEATLLDSVAVNLRGAATPTPFVTNIDYDAKGQRTLIAYGNGARTTYAYDPLTFRLARLRTTRPPGTNGLGGALFADPTVVQDLLYTYDPAGNITRIADAALPTVFYNNEQVTPVSTYLYDATYRLISATGREHIGQTAFAFSPPAGRRRDYPFAGAPPHPNDLQALRMYTEEYAYDAVGNFQTVAHRVAGGGWTRTYAYAAASLLEPAHFSNRLTRTTVGSLRRGLHLYRRAGQRCRRLHHGDQQHDARVGRGGPAAAGGPGWRRHGLLRLRRATASACAR